jgi:putative sigma-54 modulation protein
MTIIGGSMQITIVGRHFDVTEPIKKYVDGKLLKLEKFSHKIKEAHIVLEVQKFRHIAEIVLYLKDFRLTATEESRDMYASIDKALGSLHKQLLKLRDRIKEHKARGKERPWAGEEELSEEEG